ncbi:TonB-dependent receptor plug domain-containing protein [Pseudochrobactrum sp. HB0163]|uniref:TonB-dependent receptor plug domain-containing protein n=1 Tax=Pseudochrobactrum sp. HB0163 TaxID=3450708 RepID=UPI003F6DF7BD
MTRNLLNLKINILALGTALVVCNCGTAWAEEKNQQTIQLKEIVVTAGRTPLQEGKTGRAVTVITGKQLEQNQVRYLADALRLVPGFSVSRSGTKGGMTNIRVRGAEADHLLVMIDGVKVNSASGEAYDFGALQTEDIERIEILRGPQSAFWGSDALAGVVNIITKGGKRDGFKVSGTTEVGSQNSWLGGVLLQGGAENYDMALSASYRRTKGFNISNFGDEKDGDTNLTLNGKVNVDLSEAAKLDATLRYVKNRTDLDDMFSPDPMRSLGAFAKKKDLIGSLGLTIKGLDDALTQKIRLSGSDQDYKSFEARGNGKNRSKRLSGSYQVSYVFDTPSFAVAHHTITGGLEWQREIYTNVLRHERETYSFVGEYNGEFYDQIYLNVALRHDINDEFKDATTYSVSGAWAIPETTAKLHASLGTGNKNPTFYEMFADEGWLRGNPGLTPEKSFGWDVGVEHKFFDDLLVFDVTYFNQNLTDKITYDDQSFPNTYFNDVGRSKRHGVELSATLNLLYGFTAGGTYTYTSSRNPKGEVEVRRPRHSGSVNVAYTFYEDRARLFGEAIFNGEIKDAGRTLDKYTVVNIGGSYKFTDKLEGFARIENLFDKKYQEVYGYNTPGRGFFAGLKASF